MPTSSHSMKIGNITFDRYPVFLAPMEDVTDPAFRLECKEFGADLVYTEFVSADALVRFVNRTMQKLTIVDEERPVAIQIYGKDPQTMVDAAKIVAESNPDIIDINFGCPVKKIASKGAGAGLLRDIPRLLDITQSVVKAVNLPVTVKTRLGWDDNSKIICTLARQLQDCGIAALAIHGRTRSQMYTGEADWTLIGEVKNDPKIKIPIIGNGDITTPEAAADKFYRYGVTRSDWQCVDFCRNKKPTIGREQILCTELRKQKRDTKKTHNQLNRVAKRRTQRYNTLTTAYSGDTYFQGNTKL